MPPPDDATSRRYPSDDAIPAALLRFEEHTMREAEGTPELRRTSTRWSSTEGRGTNPKRHIFRIREASRFPSLPIVLRLRL
ncbi:hypothetical protein PM082_003180 [Marasmius tenuissimus]|nr:hypothetical protein PM082_003180 [Marasmius tenuissimus]